MKQKKPPPGATLIARLKERRLQREQGSEEATVPESVLDVEAHPADSSAPTGENVNISVKESAGTALDLLHKTISIDDLRPSTDDYQALTDEIKLAGRFAAIGLIAQGMRLARIHNAEIHREHYTSFEEYCRKEHNMSATYAYRLMRMSEMAEKIAERPLEESNLPDPFEVMLSLGHRHLMALLPLTPEKAEEYLVNGIPVDDAEEGAPARVPIERATEKQIRLALKQTTTHGDSLTDQSQKRAETLLIRNLGKLVKMLEECAVWLDESPAEFELVKMEKGESLAQLATRFRSASQRISEALEEQAEVSEET